jgi:hypothetical protein
MDSNERRVLRRRLDDADFRVDRLPPRGDLGSPAMVGKVFDAGHMPHGVPGVFTVQPQRVHFDEKEGAPVTFKTMAGKPKVVVLREGAPKVGDYLLSSLVNGRWVAETVGDPKDAPCCQCLPQTFLFQADLTVQEALAMALWPAFADLDIQFDWGPSPVRSIVIVPLEFGNNPFGNVAGYIETPDLGYWAAAPAEITEAYGVTHYWLYFTGCTANVVPLMGGGTVYPTAAEAGLDGDGLQYGALDRPVHVDASFPAIPWPGTIVQGLLPRDCDHEHIESFFWRTYELLLGVSTDHGTGAIDLIGEFGYSYYQNKDCIPLETANSVAGGTLRDLRDLQDG